MAFDITAQNETKGVTNAAAKVTNGATNTVIDTAAIFGKEVIDTKAKVNVSLIAIKPKATGVQLWADGPFWAEANLGESEVQDHPEYGGLYKFDDAAKAVTDALGEGWRLPTPEELQKLDGEIPGFCTNVRDDTTGAIPSRA